MNEIQRRLCEDNLTYVLACDRLAYVKQTVINYGQLDHPFLILYSKD